MAFDDIPEDTREGYPCVNDICGGSIMKSLDGTHWECDECDFNIKLKPVTKKKEDLTDEEVRICKDNR
jgi:hypothetical protein